MTIAQVRDELGAAIGEYWDNRAQTYSNGIQSELAGYGRCTWQRVLAHAIADSIFGALGLPDIGQQFPDDVSWTKDLDSKIILQHAAEQISQHGYSISNIDSVIIAQRPKLAEYISVMQLSIADILKVSHNAIGIKTKTNEGICAIGSGKAIAAISNCLLVERL